MRVIFMVLGPNTNESKLSNVTGHYIAKLYPKRHVNIEIRRTLYTIKN
jgi:hypothetical protein